MPRESSSSKKEKKPKKEGGESAESAPATPAKAVSKSAPAAAAASASASASVGGDDDFEVRSLASVGDADAASVYSQLPSEVFNSFDKLQEFARRLNTSMPIPEFVLVGPAGGGKTALLEAFIGEQIAQGGSATVRPVHYTLVNNSSASSPKVSVKRDLVSKLPEKEVSIADLGAAIAERSQKATDTPILVTIELQNTCNMTLIDSPGLDGSADREEVVLNLVRGGHRRVIAVESAQEWNSMTNVALVKKFDPDLTRTAFVYTHFQKHLQNFTSTREVNKFLSGAIPDAKTYFVTVPSSDARKKASSSAAYRTMCAQAERRDLNSLEQLQFDKRHEVTVGLGSLRRHMLAVAWKSYQNAVPQVLKQLRAEREKNQHAAKVLGDQLDSFNTSKLRSVASNHVVEFLQVLDSLIAGTSLGNPAVNGQTLDEEKNAHGEGDWVDMYNRIIRLEPAELGIPYWDNKVYGGQQFERLLSEFKAVAGGRTMVDISMNDVATAAGINKLNNVPNYAWAAADLAQQKSQDSFLPLIEQLTNRAVYIVKRLTDIADKIMEGRRKERGVTHVEDVTSYPYFTYHVKDVFYKFVDGTAKNCREKCLDEFYSARTIYWDLQESGLGSKEIPLDRNDNEETEVTVKKLSTDVFLKLRERITTNVLLKFYNFFLVPIQAELGSVLQGKINTMTDEQLEQLFDVSATKQRLTGDLDAAVAKVDAASNQDKLFMDYANSFSHPLKSLE